MVAGKTSQKKKSKNGHENTRFNEKPFHRSDSGLQVLVFDWGYDDDVCLIWNQKMNQVIPGDGHTIGQWVLHDLRRVPMNGGGPIVEFDGFDRAVFNKAAR